MTDRQTDRSSCWIATAYNDEISILQDATKYPPFVKEVHGGLETCPQTHKLHFQGAIILHTQQRLSALKRWLPTAHLEPAKSKEAVKKYCMKAETAVGEKTVRNNTVPYLRMDELLTLVGNIVAKAQKALLPEYLAIIVDDDDRKREYWWAVKQILEKNPRYISSFSDARFKTAWQYTAEVWINQPTLSITESADNETQESVNLISPVGIYNADVQEEV